MPAIGRCPLLGGVRYWEVSAIGRCQLLGGVRYSEVNLEGFHRIGSKIVCPLRGVRYSACPLYSEVSLYNIL